MHLEKAQIGSVGPGDRQGDEQGDYGLEQA
jgi:hypothetical protein